MGEYLLQINYGLAASRSLGPRIFGVNLLPEVEHFTISGGQITPENFDFNKLSKELQDSYNDFHKKLTKLLIDQGEDPKDTAEVTFIKGWLKQNPQASYEAVAPVTEGSSVKPDTKPGNTETPRVSKKSLDELFEIASEKSAKGSGSTDPDVDKSLDSDKTNEEDKPPVINVDEPSKNVKVDVDAPDNSSKPHDPEVDKDELEMCRKDAEDKLKKFANTLGDNFVATPLANAKLSGKADLKEGLVRGFSAAAAKMKLSQDACIDELRKELRPVRASNIDFDFFDWDSEVGELILSLCWYACVNGPVGVNKPTKFGMLPGSFSIKDVFEKAGYPEPVTNSMWKRFCRSMADYIDTTKVEVKEGNMFSRFGKLWPQCDAEFVTREAYKKNKQAEFLKAHGEAFEKTL